MRIQPSILAGAVAFALALGVAHAEQKPVPTNPGQPSGTPTSTPTHTVPAAPSAERLVIKTKSSPPVAPQNPSQIEERGANPTNPMGKPSAASLGAVRQCGPGMVWVQDGPHHGQGHCERKPVPQD
ncbi:MAG: hypothetical protein ACOZCP_13935 [Pseudomonadota bacterium]|jgi:hypothetical protein